MIQELDAAAERDDTRLKTVAVSEAEYNPNLPMIIGEKVPSPYDLDVLEQAWEEIYDTSVEIPPTHKYVRFLPDGAVTLKRLYDYFPDVDFSDFPLDREILQDGGWYHDPDLDEDAITYLYAVLPVEVSLPDDVVHKVIKQIALLPDASYLVKKAYELTDNDYLVFPPVGVPSTLCEPECPNYPECLDPFIPCDGTPEPEPCLPDCSNYPNCEDIGPVFCGVPCSPLSEDWPECLEFEEPQNPPVFSACGCAVSSNPRRPGGCVVFDDTQLGEQGLRNVKVTVSSGFRSKSTFTNNNGCWMIDETFAGRPRVKVKFKSDRITIRGIMGNNIFTYSDALDYRTGKLFGSINNIKEPTHIVEVQDDENIGKMRWYAAHYNNGVYEYDDMAGFLGIGTPPNDMDILLTNYATSASAPMFDEMSNNPLIFIGANGVLNAVGGAVPIVDHIVPSVGVDHLLSFYVSVFAPDVYNGYGAENKKSDVIMSTVYHEYGHAAHYHALNDDMYWLGNVVYTIQNAATNNTPPYGPGTDPQSGKTAIIEAWGNHIEVMMTDLRYGLEHSLSAISASPAEIEEERWLFHRLESFNPTNGSTSGTGADSLHAWIPEGLFLDCIDNNADNPTGVVEGVDTGFETPGDLISGYSHTDIFNTISDSNLTEIQQVRDVLKFSFLPAGQSQASVNLIFQRYGFN